MTNIKDQTDIISGIKQFEKDTDHYGTVIEKVKQDNGYWLLIKFDSEKEPRWVHESRLSRLTEQ